MFTIDNLLQLKKEDGQKLKEAVRTGDLLKWKKENREKLKKALQTLSADAENVDSKTRLDSKLKLGLCKICGLSDPIDVVGGYHLFFDILIEGRKFSECASDYLKGHKDSDIARIVFRSYQALESKESGNNLKVKTIMGWSYLEGFGTEKDGKRAFKIFNGAAHEEYAPAQYYRGMCYAQSIGMRRPSGIKAVKDFIFSAEQEYAPGQYSRGRAYQRDFFDTTPRLILDLKRAFEDYELSAEQEYAPAELRLSECYRFNIGTGLNASAASEWNEKAILQKTLMLSKELLDLKSSALLAISSSSEKKSQEGTTIESGRFLLYQASKASSSSLSSLISAAEEADATFSVEKEEISEDEEPPCKKIKRK